VDSVSPLIHYYFPSEQASRESQRERGAKFPPLFYLHLWWARRPLAASRAALASAAVDASEPDRRFIEEFLSAIKLAGKLARPAYVYHPDRKWIAAHSRVGEATLVDMFAGGGSVSFEALRLGYRRVVAVEYNPVAYVILRATLEYPLGLREKLPRLVEEWSKWLLERVRERVAHYFPPHPRGQPVSYVWVRVYRCPDGTLMPALANPLLSRDKLVALRLEGFRDDGFPVLRVVRVGSPEEAREYATVKRKVLQCARGGVLDSKALAAQYRRAMESWEAEGRYGYHPAVLAAVKLGDGSFTEPTREMLEAYEAAERDLRSRWDELLVEDLVPAERIPEGAKTREILVRGIDRFYKLFNARQILVHATVVEAVRRAYEELLDEGESVARAVATYLALAHGRLLAYNSVLTLWDSYGGGSIGSTFSRHAYSFGEDFGEGDAVAVPGGLPHWVLFGRTGLVAAVKRIVELLNGVEGSASVVLGDAADASVYSGLEGVVHVAADPPYYDNVQYAELSDFFYVWLKRSLGRAYAGVFAWELTPKSEELVVNRARGRDGEWFVERLRDAFAAVREAGGDRLTVMYAHRSSEGLYALFQALLDAGWKPVGAWSVAAEQPRSLHIAGKAAARSMLVIGSVPRSGSGGCYWDAALKSRVVGAVREAVRRALELGLSYVDASMASIGAAFAVVGDCWPLRKLEGGIVSVNEVIDYAVRVGAESLAREVLGAGVDPLTSMYVMARLVHGEPEYDDLRRLGYAYGVRHEEFIERFTDKPRSSRGRKVYPVLPLDRVSVRDPKASIVEALASAVKAFESGGVEAMKAALEAAGHGFTPQLCRVAELLYSDAGGAEKSGLAAVMSLCGSNASSRAKRLDEFL